jgi:hypothetical protein
MAQIARKTGVNAPTLISPPGYEVISETGVATEVIARGQLCVLGASGWSKAATSAKLGHGIAAKDYVANQKNCEFIIDGEIAGYEISGGTALTPGADIYPSATTAGELATDVVVWSATTPSTPVQPQMRATGPDRIRVRF